MPLDLSDFMIEHRFLTLLDIRGYSELNDDQQVQVVQVVTNSSLKFLKDRGYEKSKIFSSFIPTGDGFYLIGHDVNSLMLSKICIIFAVSLRNELIKSFKTFDFKCQGVKIALHIGTTRSFRDIAGNKNFVGTGMNEIARLLSPKNKPEIAEITEKFYRHENSVIISQATLDKIGKIEFNNLRISDSFTIQAKHKRGFLCRFIDLPLDSIYNII